METELTRGRFYWGIIAGALIPIGILSAYIGFASGTRIWMFYFAGGVFWAVILIPTIIIPASRLLQRKRMLNVLWAMFLGGLTSVVPLLPLMDAIGLGGNHSASQYVGPIMTPMIENGKLTAAGWYQYFVVVPSQMFPFGAFGGLLAWLIAVGWRFRI